MLNPKLEFRGLKKTSLIEWPGKVVAIGFTGGCNMKCPWCQNPDLVLESPGLPKIREDEILNYLDSRRKWLDGIIITGGEPTIHPGLLEFAERVKGDGFEFGLETNGSKPGVLTRLIDQELVDYVAMDVKAPLDEAKYRQVTKSNISINDIRESIKALENSSINHDFRTTINPLLTENDVVEIARKLRGSERYYIQQFDSTSTLDKSFQGVEPYPREVLERIKDRVARFFNECEIRGVEPFKT